MPDRPALIAVDQVEDLRHARREALHPQVVVEEERRDLRGFQQVLEVAVGPCQLGHAMRELAIHRLQFLVDRLQLLLRGLQLLVRRLQLLVDRLVFLVRGFELLVGALELLDGRLQPILGGAELALDALHVLVAQQARIGLRRFRLGRIAGAVIVEEHHEVQGIALLLNQRLDGEPDASRDRRPARSAGAGCARRGGPPRRDAARRAGRAAGRDARG